MRGITIHGSFSLMKYISSIIRFESQNDSLIQGLPNGCCISSHENNINLVVHLPQSSWVTRCIVNEQYYFQRNFFSEQ